MPDFVTGEIARIGIPIGAGAETQQPSRSDRAGVIVAALVSLAIYERSNELTDVINAQVNQFEEAVEADKKTGDTEVLTGYSIDLDSRVLTRYSLLARYRAAGHKAYALGSEPLNSLFTDIELNKRRPGEQVFEPKHPFQGRVVGWLQGGDHPTEKGLHLVGKTWSDQQMAAQANIDAYAEDRTDTGLCLPSWGDFITAYAAEAEAYDGVTLDGSTFSRLVQHDIKPCDVRGHFAHGGMAVSSEGGELGSRRSDGHARPAEGVRFLMGQIQPKLEA
ncbi:hypothetical protein KY385_02275 [Candidatus Parcubacteria bacterium]|nr:hypothetical protein [Candidatus Parcubacteria bacterium]